MTLNYCYCWSCVFLHKNFAVPLLSVIITHSTASLFKTTFNSTTLIKQAQERKWDLCNGMLLCSPGLSSQGLKAESDSQGIKISLTVTLSWWSSRNTTKRVTVAKSRKVAENNGFRLIINHCLIHLTNTIFAFDLTGKQQLLPAWMSSL